MNTRTIVLILLTATGCRKEEKLAPAPVPSSVTPAENTAGATVAPAPTASGFFLPAKIDTKRGVVFAETQGGTVEATTPGRGTANIADGTVVDVAMIHEADMSDGEASTVDIVVGGQALRVPARRVLVESSLQRSADGSVAVFRVIDSCGDLCHTFLYVLARDGRRKELGDGVVDVVIAWRPDGKEVAIGSGQLWLVSLPDLGVRTIDVLTAPAYAPDGALYARDHDGSAFVVPAAGKPKQLWKAKPAPEPDPEAGDYGAEDPPPVTFDSSGRPKLALPN